MKKAILLIAAVCTLSCSDKFNIDKPEEVRIDVRLTNPLRYDAEGDVYVVRKEEAVEFSFKGEIVDDILFYSGESGHEFRYRDRTSAVDDAALETQISVVTSMGSPNEEKPGTYSLMVMGSDGEWTVLGEDLRGGNMAAADVTKSIKSTELPGKKELRYAVVSASPEAQYNRLILKGFTVSNVETRDYGYTLDGVEVAVKKTRSTPVFDSFSFFDDSYRSANNPGAASWCMRNPELTRPDGYAQSVPNSQYYAWNVAEEGLRYGEGSGYPWVTVNKFGQAIRCTYNTEVSEPKLPLTLADGRVLTSLPDALRKQPCESWLVSRSCNARLVGRDEYSNCIKNKAMNMVWNFSNQWVEAGRYRCSFVFINQNRNESHSSVVEFDIIVVE